MKIILAPDKFKGSLTGLEFCDAVAAGIKRVHPQVDIVQLPLADGGDGTIDVANFYLNGEYIKVIVHNPLFKQTEAHYLFAGTTKTAFIEMAEASGLKLLKSEELDCKNTTTLGTGELILNAVERGAKHIMLGIGGSATNDCGIGMATALGYRFLDKDQNGIEPVGKNLSKIASIDNSKVNSKLKHINFKIACDVTNPLYGKNGAAYVYAEQKGASKNDIEMLNKGLQDFSKILNSHFNVQSQDVKGAGAGGGMGIGTMLFLNGKLRSGIELIKELAQFDDKIKNADWIITGEGKLDTQTLSGKTINGVVRSAKEQHIPIAAFCGAIELQKQSLHKLGISYTASVMDKATSFDDAMKNGDKYLTTISIEFSKKLKKENR